MGHGRARPWRVVGHCSSTYSSQSVSDQIPIPHTMFPESAPQQDPGTFSRKRIPPQFIREGPGSCSYPLWLDTGRCLSAPRHLQWMKLITQIHLSIRSPLCTQTTITVPFLPQTLRPTAPLSLVPHPILENYSLMPPSRCPQYSSLVHCYWGAPYG